MSRKAEKRLIVALDVGTSKVAAIVGEVDVDGRAEILGVGIQPSQGMRKGGVINIDATVNSIQQAIREAERQSGCQIHSAYTGISGIHIAGINSHGMAAIQDGEVTSDDMRRVVEAAQAIIIPPDRKILQIIPQTFIIDRQDGIHDPVGMSGVRLEVKVHIITSAISAAENIAKCVQRCELDVDDLVLNQIASSCSVLTAEEKSLGVCLVDIGAGTTDIAIFIDGSIIHTAVIPIAGDQATGDIAAHQHISIQNAEELKVKHAYVSAMPPKPDEPPIEVPTIGDRPPRQLSPQTLADVVRCRIEELLYFVREELGLSGYYDRLPAGLVITGGTARLPGIIELAEQVFPNIPVRLGLPQGFTGQEERLSNPAYATAVGLVIFGAGARAVAKVDSSPGGGEIRSKWERLKIWLKGNF